MLDVIMAALREVGGYLVWRADDGEQFVAMTKREFDRMSQPGNARDVQLTLSASTADKSASSADKTASSAGTAPRGADEPASPAGMLLDRINREIALYRESEEEAYVEEALPENTPSQSPSSKGGEDTWKVRFEPLRGDLPPELQE